MRGEYWTVEPPVSVIPKPIQKPHPPIWVAATNPTTFELAADRGLGVLCFTLGVELAQVAERINIYRDADQRRAAGGRDGKQPGLDEHHGSFRRRPVRGRASRA